MQHDLLYLGVQLLVSVLVDDSVMCLTAILLFSSSFVCRLLRQGLLRLSGFDCVQLHAGHEVVYCTMRLFTHS